MKFKQFYLGCLAHASYYIGSETEAAIIDPQRDVQQYLDEAETNNQKIKYIIETHSHADFVSGHIELAEKTGAEIIYGQRANTTFPTHKVKDGDELNIGKIKLKFLETPGHTPEGITILAETTGEPLKMFTGDTLFIGDVGRPDLIGSKGFTAEEMAGFLYDSLHVKILPLPDETEVYPAHGAGSLCGKSLSKETWSTLGNQRQFNYALQPMTKEEFVKIVAADQSEVPAYFPKSAAKNLEGSSALEDLPKPTEFSSEEIANFDGVVIDVRKNFEYGAAHIPNAINIGLGGQFASWAGTLISIGTPIAIVADSQEQVDEAFMRLARVGHETVAGFILMKDYVDETKTVEQISVEEVSELTQTEKFIQLIDVRRVAEYASGHAYRAWNYPLDTLEKNLDKLHPDSNAYVICQSGYRSSLATGILESAGFKVYNVTGGTKAWIDAGLQTEVSATATAGS
ncbi:MAG TPA: MBL fold metallo-hydrolase [Pyrinomonadaceae bacterium]|nr:MBL fold metallo-hydrolase [Pyrinomonadaceae bacterium]